MKFKIMSEKGDSGFDYDSETAEIKFNELKGAGFLPVVSGKAIHNFDPDVDCIVWMLAIMGG